MDQQESGSCGSSEGKIKSVEVADLYAKKVCIYCLGEYGIETFYYLKRFDIVVACFGDRDEKKHGYVFENLYCISFEEVLQLEINKWIVIVAIKEPENLVHKFQNKGICTINYKEVFELLRNENEMFTKTPMQNISEIIKCKEMIVEVFCKETLNKRSGNVELQQIAYDFLKRAVKNESP